MLCVCTARPLGVPRAGAGRVGLRWDENRESTAFPESRAPNGAKHSSGAAGPRKSPEALACDTVPWAEEATLVKQNNFHARSAEAEMAFDLSEVPVLLGEEGSGPKSSYQSRHSQLQNASVQRAHMTKVVSMQTGFSKRGKKETTACYGTRPNNEMLYLATRGSWRLTLEIPPADQSL